MDMDFFQICESFEEKYIVRMHIDYFCWNGSLVDQ